MKRISIIFASILLLSACGGGGSSPEIAGPMLSLDEAGAMVIDQLYINGGLDDEYSTRGEFSVYLRDAATGKDISCTSQEDGMKWLSTAGLYYGGLNVPLREVDSDHPSSVARFKVLFVEKDSEDCPKEIDRDDDIAGESAEFTFEDLLEKPIWATNGRAAVVFRNIAAESLTVASMAPALEDGLSIDKLYFEDGRDDEDESRYYLIAEEMANGEPVNNCQMADAQMEKVRHGGIVYSALGFSFACLPASDPAFAAKEVRVSLYVQRESGPELIGETEIRPIAELIGEKVMFTNGGGYVSFRAVMTAPFSTSVVRLGELENLSITSLTYTLTPAANPTVELHVTDVEGGYSIACAGADQGLSGVGVPGNHAGLSAGLLALQGQTELFGFGNVQFQLINRTDGLECPSPLASTPTILGASQNLASAALTGGAVAFSNGAGSVTFE